MIPILTKKSVRRRPCRPFQTNQGFTLLEVVISLGIMAIALTAVFQLQASNLNIQDEARFLTRASQLAQSKLAELETSEQIQESSDQGDFGEEFPDFAFHTEISAVSDQEGFYKVLLTVTRVGEETGSRFLLQTYLYRPEK
jgi:prepilin-type N-terminal cleavage/methylation domain-containing protein